jgi:hypothetical protein
MVGVSYRASASSSAEDSGPDVEFVTAFSPECKERNFVVSHIADRQAIGKSAIRRSNGSFGRIQ